MARLTRSVMPTPWTLSACHGIAIERDEPGATCRGPEAVPGTGVPHADVGGVDTRIETDHEQHHSRAHYVGQRAGPDGAGPDVVAFDLDVPDVEARTDEDVGQPLGCPSRKEPAADAIGRQRVALVVTRQHLDLHRGPHHQRAVQISQCGGQPDARHVEVAHVGPPAVQGVGPEGERFEVALDEVGPGGNRPALLEHGPRRVETDDRVPEVRRIATGPASQVDPPRPDGDSPPQCLCLGTLEGWMVRRPFVTARFVDSRRWTVPWVLGLFGQADR